MSDSVGCSSSTKLCSATEIVHGAIGPGTDAEKGAFQQPVLLLAKNLSEATAEHEVFGPVATLMPYDGTAAQTSALVGLGKGSLVASIFTDGRDFASEMLHDIAP